MSANLHTLGNKAIQDNCQQKAEKTLFSAELPGGKQWAFGIHLITFH